jgi:hypothetical protein
MKMFYVKVTGYAPYPISIEYYEKAANWATAIRRAVAKYFKDYKKEGRMRVKNISIQAGYGIMSSMPSIKLRR